MSAWDYLLPWKAIPNMAKDVKAAWGGKGKNRHDSFAGAIGKYADPVGSLFGDNWMEFFHEKIPREINRALEPVGEFHRDYLDPIYQVAGDTKWGKAITDHGVNKGGDWSALITGGVLAAGALGGGGGAAGASGGGGGTGGSSGWASMDWTDPNTYMQMAQQFGMPGQQQQPQQPPPEEELLPERWRRKRPRYYT